MTQNTLKQRTGRVIGAAALAAITAFGCKEPEVEKNCSNKTGAMVVCPQSIRSLQFSLMCVGKDEKTLKPEPGGNEYYKPLPGEIKIGGETQGVKISLQDKVAEGMYSLEFTTGQGIKGWTKIFGCTTEK